MRWYSVGFCVIWTLICGESTGSFERPRNRGNHIQLVNSPREIQYSKDLLQAAIDGEEEAVRSLVIRGGNVNFRDNRGITPLIGATENRHSNIVKYLLYCSARVNEQRTDTRYSPLMIACRNNDSEIVKLLLRFGANIDLRCENGFTVFDFAMNNNNIDILLKLLTISEGIDTYIESIRDENIKLLFYAIRSGRMNVIRYCTEELNVDVNSKGTNGETPLIVACKNGYDDVVQYLLEHDAKINETMKGSRTPLMFACIGGFVNIVKMLIERDAEVNLVDGELNDPLIFALNNCHIEIANMLIEAGSNLNQKNKQGETPLSIATFHYELAGIGQRYTEQALWKKIIELIKGHRSSNTSVKSLHR